MRRVHEPQRRFTYEEHAIDVVQVAMLPTAIVDVLTRHADLRAVEDGRLKTPSASNFDIPYAYTHLIHIIPDTSLDCAINPRPLIALLDGLEQRLPPVPATRMEEVDPSTAAAPAPSLIVGAAISLLDQEPLLGRLLVNRVVIRALQVRVDDDDHLE